jgi:hypothetical protein
LSVAIGNVYRERKIRSKHALVSFYMLEKVCAIDGRKKNESIALRLIRRLVKREYLRRTNSIYSINAVAKKQMTAKDNPIRMSNI